MRIIQAGRNITSPQSMLPLFKIYMSYKKRAAVRLGIAFRLRPHFQISLEPRRYHLREPTLRDQYVSYDKRVAL